MYGRRKTERVFNIYKYDPNETQSINVEFLWNIGTLTVTQSSAA